MITLDIQAELARMVATRMARIATRRQAQTEHTERRRRGLRCRHARRLTQTSAGPAGGERRRPA